MPWVVLHSKEVQTNKHQTVVSCCYNSRFTSDHANLKNASAKSKNWQHQSHLTTSKSCYLTTSKSCYLTTSKSVLPNSATLAWKIPGWNHY